MRKKIAKLLAVTSIVAAFLIGETVTANANEVSCHTHDWDIPCEVLSTYYEGNTKVLTLCCFGDEGVEHFDGQIWVAEVPKANAANIHANDIVWMGLTLDEADELEICCIRK